MNVNGDWLRRFAMGIHSEIPVCCVFYFCNIWVNYSQDDLMTFRDLRNEPDEIQYIRCPECYESGNWVKIHECVPNGQECFMKEFNKAFLPPMRDAYNPDTILDEVLDDGVVRI